MFSRLPLGRGSGFDVGEDEADLSKGCMVRAINQQLKPANAKSISKESKKDPTILTEIRYVQQGCLVLFPKACHV